MEKEVRYCPIHKAKYTFVVCPDCRFEAWVNEHDFKPDKLKPKEKHHIKMEEK